MNIGAASQLQRDLTRRLMLPVLAIVAMTVGLGIFGANLHIERVFDRWLFDTAWSLADQVRTVNGQAEVTLSPQAEAMLRYDVVDRTSFEVVQGMRHVLGQPGIPQTGAHLRTDVRGGRAFDAQFGGQAVRVVWVPVPTSAGLAGAKEHAWVGVAETGIKRQRARDDLLLTLAPGAALVLAAAMVVALALRRTLGTLQQIAARWNARSHASVDDIPLDDVPRELLPFAQALNDLLGRVRHTMEQERHFAATVAHQLRTPLTGLRLGLSRLAEAPDEASRQALMGELNTGTQRAARLVQQLLALSRLDPLAHTSLRRVDVDLVALAHDVGESYLDAALAHNIQLEMVSDADVTVVQGEPDLLCEVLGNLLDNALRHTPAGGRILISVTHTPAAIEVADSGPGVPAEERQAVFGRFVRGRHPTGDGSGLGLAIVKDIAALHGAQVSMGQSEWGGARVTLQFPPSTPPPVQTGPLA